GLIAAANRVRVSTNQHHVVPGTKGPYHRRFDLAVFGNRTHLQIVCHHQMLITEFTAQEIRDDVAAERRRLQQAARYALHDVDVRKAAVTNHYATHAIVLALEKFYVGREVLR